MDTSRPKPRPVPYSRCRMPSRSWHLPSSTGCRCDLTSPQGLTLNERHGIEQQVTDLSGREERGDVWMLQACGELNLTSEAVGAHTVGQLSREHLHHHTTTQG